MGLRLAGKIAREVPVGEARPNIRVSGHALDFYVSARRGGVYSIFMLDRSGMTMCYRPKMRGQSMSGFHRPGRARRGGGGGGGVLICCSPQSFDH